ncbi:N-formylglutamate amidohydrolase [Ramlibacter sp.]|uniref:N-formylglutamate amidohydrolase n=1 Tax=Ramlibacter sp. TaxID=1917967 RepID=UPI003D10DC9D
MKTLLRTGSGRTPLVLDSPHSGVDYPDDFGHACDLAELRRAEDTHVEKLYDFAAGLGVAWVEALFPRSWLDVNRDTSEIDVDMIEGPWDGPVPSDDALLAKVRLGKGLVWRLTDDGVPIYDRKLGADEIRRRIASGWTPYHDAVAKAVDEAHARHGYSIHVNCHSMPSFAGTHATGNPGVAHPDFVIGDRDGTTADPRLSHLIGEHLRALGYDVAYNDPYKGVELVRRHSDPARDRHSIQVEVNRKLYMDENSFALHAGADKLKRDLRSLVELLLRTDPRRLA